MKPAPLWKYLFAMIYDGLLVLALLFLATLAMLPLNQGEAWSERQWLAHLVYQGVLIAVWAGFYVFFWLREGQTLGMRAWRMKLISRDGAPLTLRQVLIRWLGGWLSAAPLGMGYWWMLFDSDRLTWHDRLSGTAMRILPKQGAA